MPFPGEPLIRAYEQGVPVVLVTGRSLRDLCVDEDGRIRPILEVLRRELLRRGLVLITYSLAEGLRWSPSGLEEGLRRAVEQALQSHGLLGGPADPQEVLRVVRGIASLVRGTEPPRGGVSVRFAVLLEFAEHLAPAAPVASVGVPVENTVIVELAYLMAHSLTIRNAGNFVVLSAREGMVDALLTRSVHRIRLRQPALEEKEAFVESLLRVYAGARLSEGLTPRTVAHLTANTPNRLVEQVIRASHRTGDEVTPGVLARQKAEAVEELSEGTLTLLNTARVEGVELVGANVQTPLEILRGFCGALARGDRTAPVAVLLVGPPGAGKTDLALLAARDSGVPAFQMHSPKAPFVGQTEARARLQQALLEEWVPNVAFVDEVTEALPLDRGEVDTDSGATRAVSAVLLTALSDESRSGKSMLVGTTNCPWRMSAAMRTRFYCVPVLFPLAEDFPEIVWSVAGRLEPNCNLDRDHPRFREAAAIFHSKRAGVRQIRSGLLRQLALKGGLDEEAVLDAARSLVPSLDSLSVVYADLWAVRAAGFLWDLPWYRDPGSYPFPEHLRGLVSRETGEVDLVKLDEELRKLAPHARV